MSINVVYQSCTMELRPSRNLSLPVHEMHALLKARCLFVIGNWHYQLSTPRFFDLTSFSFPWACFLDLQWFCKMLILVDSNSWQALQNSFPPVIHKCSLGKDCGLSCKPIFLTSVFFPCIFLPCIYLGSTSEIDLLQLKPFVALDLVERLDFFLNPDLTLIAVGQGY